MTDIKKMITETKENKKEQYYPETHADAVIGLDERIIELIKQEKEKNNG